MKYLFKLKNTNEAIDFINNFYIYLKYKDREPEYRRGLVSFAKPKIDIDVLKFMAYAGKEDYVINVSIRNTELVTIKELKLEYDDPNVINFDSGDALKILKRWFEKLFNCEIININE